MAHFLASVDCPGSPEDVFRYVADFRNAAHWDPTVTRVEGEEPGLGAHVQVFLGIGAYEWQLDYETRLFEPSRRVVFQAETSLLRSLDTIEVEKTEHGCRVHYDADIRLLGLASLFELPTHWGFQISGRRSLAGLERALQSIKGSP